MAYIYAPDISPTAPTAHPLLLAWAQQAYFGPTQSYAPVISPPATPASYDPPPTMPPPADLAPTQETPSRAPPTRVSPPASDTPSSSTPPPPHPPPVSPRSSGSTSSTTAVIAGVASGIAVLLVVIIVLLLIVFFRKKKEPRPEQEVYTLPRTSGAGYNQGMHPPNQQGLGPPAGTAQTGHHAFLPRQPSATSPSPHTTTEVSGPVYTSSSDQKQAFHRPSLKKPEGLLNPVNSTFTYEELVRASDGFSDANLLGKGGFGYVHRGVLRNGTEVAIKQLKFGGGQGEREYQAEVNIISRVHHRHLVSLVGHCTQGDQRLLVYEFVPNNTLEFHLHGKGRPTIDWPTRMRIAIGSAKGLTYLHEDCHPKIVHRDIKASNILLDYNFDAKVADFGLAKFFSDEHTQVTTRIMGTLGYLAPEYASSGKVTYKSDVFSFGVMLLELITGRRPVDKTTANIVDWARPLLERAIDEYKFSEITDPRLNGNYKSNEMACMVACATACISLAAKHRPKMSKIVRVLEGGVSLEELYTNVTLGQSLVNASGPEKSNKSKFMRTIFSSEETESSGLSEAAEEQGRRRHMSKLRVPAQKYDE